MGATSEFYNELKAAEPFFILAGPNVIESADHVMKMARQIKSVTDELGLKLVFKSSFDKANRTSMNSFRGPGLEEGLKILERVKITYDLPIVTDVHETSQVMVNSAFKVRTSGNPNVMVCERGTMFGYSKEDDPCYLKSQQGVHGIVTQPVADITHSLQQPAGRKIEGGGVASGGLRELIPCVARTCVAVGIDGIFMEVHDNPLQAPVDGPTQWPLRNLKSLLEELVAIGRVTKGKQQYNVDLTPVLEDF
ncbi:hypothetical protein AXG93_868s1510 [Marchantia polymorpha subsp. ruderalis]|uniref:3-deoxy-8-phosphooctulonate synthase n=1 Tax=Marchantia polymorpha subsp. ruderalis TaxID=1480154 RepID=A0A176VLV2_MARPO|nr:hypothetical protein AXG93_868s1510 [Marchantia polymorpha subsp. ruderalis]